MNCNTCKLKGHIDSDLHYDCDNCNSIVIGNKHIKCLNCGECTPPYLEHIDKCDVCNSCCIDIHQNYDCPGIIMCLVCNRVKKLELLSLYNRRNIVIKK